MIQVVAMAAEFPISASYRILSRVGKMGEIRINLTNTISIGLMAFVFVWLANKGLTYAGKPQWKA